MRLSCGFLHAILRADIDSILEMRGPDAATEPIEQVEEIGLVALFTGPLHHSNPRMCAKRDRSSRTTDGEEAHARNKEQMDLEQVRRDSLIDEETHQMRARELAAGASSSRLEAFEGSNTKGEGIDFGTTEGVPTTEVASFEKPDPPAC